jgi:hypothetical protein
MRGLGTEYVSEDGKWSVPLMGFVTNGSEISD